MVAEVGVREKMPPNKAEDVPLVIVKGGIEVIVDIIVGKFAMVVDVVVELKIEVLGINNECESDDDVAKVEKIEEGSKDVL